MAASGQGGPLAAIFLLPICPRTESLGGPLSAVKEHSPPDWPSSGNHQHLRLHSITQFIHSPCQLHHGPRGSIGIGAYMKHQLSARLPPCIVAFTSALLGKPG